MAALAEAFVRVRADTDDARRQVEDDFSKAGKTSGSRFGRAMKSTAGKAITALGGAMAGLFAAQKIGQFFKGAVTGASDLAESGSKVEVVFGKAAKQVLTASKTSAQAMGLSKQAYLDATGTLGNLLVSLEIAPGKAANMSQKMVKLAGDMASFNNTSPEEALEALRSGLVGETEPLKRFGVNMNEATLKTQALRMGLVKNTTEALNPQAKALAAQALIMKQTGTAQGDFARTSGGLANQQRILSARFKDVQAKIGQLLLPVITKLVSMLSGRVLPAIDKFVKFVSTNATTIRNWAVGLGIAAAAMGVLLVVTKAHAAVLAVQAAGGLVAYLKGIKLVAAAQKVWTAVQWLFNAAVTANPIGIIIVAIVALVAAIVIAYKKSETFRKIVHAALNGVKTAALAVAKWFAGPFVNFFKKVWQFIKAITRPFVVAFKVQMIFVRAALKIVGIAARWLWRNAIQPAFKGIAIIARWLWRNVIAPVGKGIGAVFKVIAAVAKWLWRNAIAPVFKGIQKTIQVVWDFLRRRVFNPLKAMMLKDVPNAFKRGRDLIGRFWKGIQSLAKKPVNFIIGTVYNKGIRGFVGKVAKFVGQKNPLPRMSLLAEGGPVPASRAGWRKRPTAIVGEGSRVHPEVVVPTDPKHRRRARGLFDELGGRLGMPMMAKGGLLGDAADFFLSPLKAVKNRIAGPVSRLVDRFGSNGLVKMLAKIPGKLVGDIVKKLGSMFGAGIGGASGPGGWRWQMAALRSRFPGLPLYSGFRPGSITATGNRSYHSMGRAVDVPPRMDVFNWIRSVYGKRTRELIFSPAGRRQLNNGGPHMYTGITRSMHFDHVHWAYKNGAWNVPQTGPALIHKREMVLPERIAGAVRSAMTGRGTASGSVVVNVGPVTVPDGATADMVTSRITYGIRSASF